MTVNFGGGGKGYISKISGLKKGQKEVFIIRESTKMNLPFILELYNQLVKRSALACVRNLSIWKYDLDRSPESTVSDVSKVIETSDGKLVGYYLHASTLSGPNISLFGFEII